MSTDTFRGFIAFYTSSVDNLTGPIQYRALFKKIMGTDMQRASDAKIKELARHLYKAYVAGLYVKRNATAIASTLSSEQIDDLIKDQVKLLKKYGIFVEHTETDMSAAAVDRRIKELASTDYKSRLAQLEEKEEAPKKTKVTKIPAAKKPAVKKSPASKKVAKSSPSAKVGPKKAQSAFFLYSAANRSKHSGSVSEVAKALGEGWKSASEATKTKYEKLAVADKARYEKELSKIPAAKRSCKDHDVKSLKALAASKGLKGYSTLKKKELCDLMKIK